MKKPALLRAALARLMPDLANDPDRLAMWVEKGNVKARLGMGMAQQRGFAWEYELTVLVKGFTLDPAVLFFVVVDWCREQQPELLGGQPHGFPFEVDILDDATVDVQIVLKLDECVTAGAAGGGAWNLAVVPQPVPIDPDAEFLRATEGPILSIWHAGQQIAPPPDA